MIAQNIPGPTCHDQVWTSQLTSQPAELRDLRAVCCSKVKNDSDGNPDKGRNPRNVRPSVGYWLCACTGVLQSLGIPSMMGTAILQHVEKQSHSC